VLSNSGANTKGHGDVESVIERVLQTWGPPLRKAMTERSLGSSCPAELVDSFMTYQRRITAEATAESLRSLQQTDLTSMLSELSSVPPACQYEMRRLGRAGAPCCPLATRWTVGACSSPAVPCCKRYRNVCPKFIQLWRSPLAIRRSMSTCAMGAVPWSALEDVGKENGINSPCQTSSLPFQMSTEARHSPAPCSSATTR
jgi:hypothetical protein